MFEQIEKIKQEYTDKYVKVDSNRAELARFKDLVGQVRTVNMSGRALVEFMDYHLNIGWFDIDLDYLKVVDKPEPKPIEAKKPAAKKPASPASAGGDTAKKPSAAAEKKLSPLEMARQADGDGAKKKQSTADVLAALRGEKGGTESPASPASAGEEAKEKPDAAKTQASGDAPAKLDRSKMSVADMIAAAKGEAAPAAKSEPAPEPVAEDASGEEAADDDIVIEEKPAAAAAGPVDKSGMSIDEMVAYCREHDG